MSEYHNTIEPKPLPAVIPAPPEGYVYVGLASEVPTVYTEPVYRAYRGNGDTWVEGHYYNDGSAKWITHLALAADSPYLKKDPIPTTPTSTWITDRLPTRDDAGEQEFVLVPDESDSDGWQYGDWEDVKMGEPWAPFPKLPPYVPPVREKMLAALRVWMKNGKSDVDLIDELCDIAGVK